MDNKDLIQAYKNAVRVEHALYTECLERLSHDELARAGEKHLLCAWYMKNEKLNALEGYDKATATIAEFAQSYD